MPVTLLRQETTWHLKLDNPVTVASAAELKEALVAWLSSGKDLELDLKNIEEIDLTVLQLLWAAARTGGKIVARASDAVRRAARDAGFPGLPGFPAIE